MITLEGFEKINTEKKWQQISLISGVLKFFFLFFWHFELQLTDNTIWRLFPFSQQQGMRRNQRPLSFASTRVEAVKRAAHERGFMQRKSKTLVSCWKGKYDRAYFLKRYLLIFNLLTSEALFLWMKLKFCFEHDQETISWCFFVVDKLQDMICFLYLKKCLETLQIWLR